MKAKDLRVLSEGELLVKERELNEELFNLRFQHATGQLENVMRIPQVKGDMARVKTILRGKVPNKVVLRKLTGLSRFQIDGQLQHLMKAGMFPEAKAATFELEKAAITDNPYKLAARLMISQLAPTDCRYFLLKHLAESGKSAYEIAKTTGASSGSLHLEQKHLMDTGLVLQDGESYAVTKRGKKVLKATEKIFFQGHPPSKLGKKKDWSLTKIFSNAAHSGICAAFLDLADMQESVHERGWVTHGQSEEAELYLHDGASFYKLARMGIVWEEDVGKSGRFAYGFSKDFAKLKQIPFSEIVRKCPFKRRYSSEDRQAADKLLQKYGIPLSVRETIDSPSKLRVGWCIATGMFAHNAIARKTGMTRTDVTMNAGMLEDAGHVHQRLPGIKIKVEERRARTLLNYLRALEGIAAGELKERGLEVKVPETGIRDKFVSLPLPPPIEAEGKGGASTGKRMHKRKETNPDRLKKIHYELKLPHRNPTADECAKKLGWSPANLYAANKEAKLLQIEAEKNQKLQEEQ
jgi:large subunit ribosomal protein L29